MSAYRFSARRDRLGLERALITRGRWHGCPYWLADSKFAQSSLIPKRVLDRADEQDFSAMSIRRVERMLDRWRRPFREGGWLRLELGDPVKGDGSWWVRPVDLSEKSAVPWGGQLGMAASADLVEHIERCFAREGDWRLLPSAGNAVLAYVVSERLRSVLMPVRCSATSYREATS